MQSVFSNVEVYIKNQQINNYNGLCVHKSYNPNIFKRATSENKRVLRCEGFYYKKTSDDVQEAPKSDSISTTRMRMLSGSDGFLMYGKTKVH